MYTFWWTLPEPKEFGKDSANKSIDDNEDPLLFVWPVERFQMSVVQDEEAWPQQDCVEKSNKTYDKPQSIRMRANSLEFHELPKNMGMQSLSS